MKRIRRRKKGKEKKMRKKILNLRYLEKATPNLIYTAVFIVAVILSIALFRQLNRQISL